MIFIIVGVGIITLLVVCLSLLRVLKPDKCPKCGDKKLIAIDMDDKGTTYMCIHCGYKFRD